MEDLQPEKIRKREYFNHPKWKCSRRMLYFDSFVGDFLYNLISFVVMLVASNITNSDQALGYVSSAYGITYCILPFILGKLSDHIGRKRSILLCYLTFVITGLVFFFATEIWQLVLGGVLEGLALSFLWPSLSSLVVEIATPHTRKQIMTNYMHSWGIGAILGPFLAGIFFDWVDVKWIFLFIIVLCITCVIATQLWLHWEKIPKEILTMESEYYEKHNDHNHHNDHNNLTRFNNNNEHENLVESTSFTQPPVEIPPVETVINPKSKPFLYLLAFSMTFFSGFYIIILQGYYVGYLAKYTELSATIIGLIVFGIPIGRELAFVKINHVSTNLKVKLMPILALIAFGLLYTVSTLKQPVGLMIVFVALGIISGVSFGGGVSIINEITEEKKGLMNGIAESLVGVAFFTSPIIPFLIFGDHPQSPFTYLLIGTLLMGGIFVFSFMKIRQFKHG